MVASHHLWKPLAGPHSLFVGSQWAPELVLTSLRHKLWDSVGSTGLSGQLFWSLSVCLHSFTNFCGQPHTGAWGHWGLQSGPCFQGWQWGSGPQCDEALLSCLSTLPSSSAPWGGELGWFEGRKAEDLGVQSLESIARSSPGLCLRPWQLLGPWTSLSDSVPQFPHL